MTQASWMGLSGLAVHPFAGYYGGNGYEERSTRRAIEISSPATMESASSNIVANTFETSVGPGT